jgi:hypothetical protein
MGPASGPEGQERSREGEGCDRHERETCISGREASSLRARAEACASYHTTAGFDGCGRATATGPRTTLLFADHWKNYQGGCEENAVRSTGHAEAIGTKKDTTAGRDVLEISRTQST